MEPHPHFALDPVFVGPPDGDCHTVLARLDPSSLRSGVKTFAVGDQDASHCQSCFRFGGRTLPLRLFNRDLDSPHPSERDRAVRFRVHVEESSDFLACRNYPKEGFVTDAVMTRLLFDVFNGQQELADLDIVDWGPLQLGSRMAFDAAMPIPNPLSDIERRENTTTVISAYELACHIVYYSGWRYPVAPAVNISYRYDGPATGFVRVGPGPYLTDLPFTSSSSVETSARGDRNITAVALDPTYQPLEVYVALPDDGERATRADEGPVFPVDESVFGANEIQGVSDSTRLVSLVQRNTHTVLAFTRHERQNVSHFSVQTRSVTLGSFYGSNRFSAWVMDFEMSTFNVIVDEKVRPSWARFISDFLGYIFFFMGLSVYTTIIGPANIIFFGLIVTGRRSAEDDGTSDFDDSPADRGRQRLTFDLGIRRSNSYQ